VTEQLRHYDPEAHEPGCLDNESSEECADPSSTHVDVFCKCHHYTEPKILSNGTDIAWPAGWTEAQADQWRREHALERPKSEAA
jgi:hypothetical protein